MIQREREEREKLRVEEETRRLDRAAQDEAERLKIAKRREDMVKEDKHFLEGLKIPEYLQAIIDEEQLEGAHVLWEKVLPLNEQSSSYLTGGVSLVWNIYCTMRSEYMQHSDGFSGSRGSMVKIGSTRDGYTFRSINITGDSRNNSLLIIGRKDKYEAIPAYFDLLLRYRDRNSIPLKYWRADGRTKSGSLLTSDNVSIGLSRPQLNQSEIRQALASIYLDTAESKFAERKLGWPFNKTVPEQDRK